MTDLEFCKLIEKVAEPYKDDGVYVFGYGEMAGLVSEVWDAAINAAKKTTIRGLFGATEKEKHAHYVACMGIAADLEAMRLGVGTDDSRDAGQAGPCARAHVTTANSDANCV